MRVEWRRLGGILLTLSLALPWCPAAHADDQAPAEAQPAAEPQPPEHLELKQGWLNADQLLRLPDWLSVGVSWTAQPFVNPVGGERQLSNWMQQGVVSLAVGSGLGKAEPQWREIDHWSINASLNQYSGDPSYASAIGALFPLQQIAYPSGLLLSELSLNRSSGGGWLTLKGGILSLNPSFITAPIFNSYVHSALNNTLNLSLVNTASLTPDSLPINPYAAWGGMVSIQPRRDLRLRYGWFDLRSTAAIAGWLGGPALSPPLAAGSAQLLQLDWSPSGLGPPSGSSVPACRRGLQLHRRGRACPQPVQVANQLPTGLISLGGISGSSEGRAAYASLTLRSGLPIGLDERVWIGGSWGRNAQQTVVPSFLGGGLLCQGLVPQRPLDLLVLGAGRTAGLGTGPESLVELGYQWQINGNLSLQPTLQWIIHPSLVTPTPPGILAASLQINLSF
jgi:porin